MLPPRGKGIETNKATRTSKAGGMGTPPEMRKKPASSGVFSRTNNDGNLATREKPGRRPKGGRSLCYITSACTRARGLADDCYELSLLRMFRREYVEGLPAGPELLAEYRAKAPRICAAIDALGERRALEVYDDLYTRGIRPSIESIVNGRWDEAYGIYRTMCEELEERFLRNDSTASGKPHSQESNVEA